LTWFGDPDPTGPVTPALREGMTYYLEEIGRRLRRGRSETLVCNDLTGQFPVFQSEERLGFCTDIVSTVAEVVAEAVVRHGALPPAPAP